MIKLNLTQKTVLFATICLIAFTTILHNPFGGYRRDEMLYTKLEFVKLLRESFPEYADFSDDSLYLKLINKYPNFRTWIKEESKGTDVLPIAIIGKPTNYRLTPPPAYYGKQPSFHSVKAVAKWIDEPSEYLDFTVPLIIVGLAGLFIFRTQKSNHAKN